MNVKKGDLAIVFKGPEENRGKIVEVGDFVGDQGAGYLNCWWVFSDKGLKTLAGIANMGKCPDNMLRKIKGGEIDGANVQAHDLKRVYFRQKA